MELHQLNRPKMLWNPHIKRKDMLPKDLIPSIILKYKYI